MLNKGMGMFGVSVHKTHPRESPEMWIFVLGGITTSEVKVMREVISKTGSQVEVKFGSTKILKACDLMKSLYVDDLLS